MKKNNFISRFESTIVQLDNQIGNYRFITGNTLKFIAISAMLLDHLCKIVLQWLVIRLFETNQITLEQFNPIYDFIRFDLYPIGTIAFPLFCFLLSEGFHYTKNRKKYIGLMFTFAIISELPFDLAFFNENSIQMGTFPFYWEYQNVFFTLFLGLVALTCLEHFACKSEIKKQKIKSILLQIACVIAISIVAKLIYCDYGKTGILYIVAFYIARKNRLYQILLFAITYIFATGFIQSSIYFFITCLLILLYNGKRGKLKLKYTFYIFYPAHIAMLYGITQILAQVLK